MESSNNQISQIRKTFVWLLTALLWLTTVALGMIAFVIFQQGLQVFSGVLLIQNEEMGLVARGGFWRIIRYTSLFLGGILWLGMVIGGMEFHFNRKRLGSGRSYRVLAWTIAIEIVLVAAGIIMQRM